MKILLVEDEKQLSEALCEILLKNKYSVDAVLDGENGLNYGLTDIYDVIILDIMLPKMNGLDVLKSLRKNGISKPVILLTAKGTIEDKIIGLDAGADDYLAKPFGIRELLARVHALLRRSPNPSEMAKEGARVLDVSGIHLDEAGHRATYNGQEIELTPREFELLLTLMNHAGTVLGREQLLKEAWDWQYVVETKTVDTHIKRLRDKLASVGLDPSIIETVRGYGYRFVKNFKNANN